jgi:methionine-rich copper-binding protein CopC
MKKQNAIILFVIAAAVVVAGIAYQHQRQKAQDIVDNSSVQTVVTQFGTSIQKVSLSAPDALDQIANVYAPYASSSLIQKWKENKSFAPGKGLSSPWPISINVTSVTKKGDGSYIVQGMVAEVTSQDVAHGGIAAQYPVTITLKKYGNVWLMTGYDAGVATSFAPKVPTTTTAQ